MIACRSGARYEAVPPASGLYPANLRPDQVGVPNPEAQTLPRESEFARMSEKTASISSPKHMASGTRVRVARPGPVPPWSEWDDDRGRTSGPVKRRMQEMFFRGDRKLTAEIAWVTSESERDELGRKGRVKIKVKESAGTVLIITADRENLQKA